MKPLHSVGIALVTNTPLQSGEGYKLCARVGYHKTTHYGYVTFRVVIHFVSTQTMY